MKHTLSRITALLLCLLAPCTVLHAAQPNIILVLFDDMGYGQPQCYNAQAALRTPNLDKFATQGMRFNDALTVAIPAAALGQDVRALNACA